MEQKPSKNLRKLTMTHKSGKTYSMLLAHCQPELLAARKMLKQIHGKSWDVYAGDYKFAVETWK